MTAPSTGDARAEDRVVEAVARALSGYAYPEKKWLDTARTAIEAYRKAMSSE